MEAFVADNFAACSQTVHCSIVGILIVNPQGEVLLLKKQTASTIHPLWETPYLNTQVKDEAHTITAERLLASYGLSATLHQAFAITHGQTVRHFIIAILNTQHTLPIESIDALELLYRPINEILADAQDRPHTYASWLHDSLDGMALHLKILLKQSTMLMRTEPLEG